MLEIPLFALILQIGFNAALNYHSYNRNPMAPETRYVRHGDARRHADSDSYLQASSRRYQASDSDQFDSEDSSLEDSSYRSVRPLQNRRDQRRNNNLRYSTASDSDVSLEIAPVGRIGPDNFADSYRSVSSVTSPTDTNFRRPYLRHKPPNSKQGQNKRYNRKANDDLSLEYNNNRENGLSAGDNENYLRSLLTLMQMTNRFRKYRTHGDDLSLEVQTDSEEDADNKRPNTLTYDSVYLDSLYSRNDPSQMRRLDREENEYDLRYKDKINEYINKLLILTSGDKLDNVSTEKSQLRSQKDLNRYNQYYRRYSDVSGYDMSPDDRLSPDDDISSNFAAFRGLKPYLRSRKIPDNDQNVNDRYNRRNNNNDGLNSLLNGRLLFSDNDPNPLTVLRLSSFDDLNFDSPQLRSGNNRINNQRNFLRLAVSANDKLSLDDDMVSDLSDLLSKNVDELNLVPNLRSNIPLNQNNNRRDNDNTRLYSSLNDQLDVEWNAPNSLSALRLRNSDNSNSELQLLRNRNNKSVNRNNFNNERRRNNNDGIEVLFDDNAASNLVPYHELTRNERLNNNRRDSDDLDSLFNDRQENDDDVPSPNDEPKLDDVNVDKNAQSSTLNLEFPWVGQLGQGPEHKKTNNSTKLRSDPDNYEIIIDASNPEHRKKYPWLQEYDVEGNYIGKNNKKVAVRTVADPLYLHPYLRSGNRNRYNRRSNSDRFDVDTSQLDNVDHPSDENLRVLALGRQGNTSRSGYSDEDPTITFPLDRRPHQRLRTRDDDSPLHSRRANKPLATTTAAPKVSKSSENVTDSKASN